jgi:hypothetical protein
MEMRTQTLIIKMNRSGRLKKMGLIFHKVGSQISFFPSSSLTSEEGGGGTVVWDIN